MYIFFLIIQFSSFERTISKSIVKSIHSNEWTVDFVERERKGLNWVWIKLNLYSHEKKAPKNERKEKKNNETTSQKILK